MIQISHLEQTPNANAKKFVTDSTLVGQGALSYETAEQAQESPVARRVFALGKINNVYIQENFVSVNADPAADWQSIQDAVQGGLAEFQPVEAIEAPPSAQPAAEGEEAEFLAKVNAAIDKFVRPALASDGGGLEVLGAEGHTVHVRYQGACGGCGMATSGTLVAIEGLLRDQVDERISLMAL